MNRLPRTFFFFSPLILHNSHALAIIRRVLIETLASARRIKQILPAFFFFNERWERIAYNENRCQHTHTHARGGSRLGGIAAGRSLTKKELHENHAEYIQQRLKAFSNNTTNCSDRGKTHLTADCHQTRHDTLRAASYSLHYFS